MNAFFVIVGTDDHPVFQASFVNSPTAKTLALLGDNPDEYEKMAQFVLHSALDPTDREAWDKSALFLKTVDSYAEEWSVSAFVAPSGARFLLLHDQRTNDSKREERFFQEVFGIYMRLALNPFYEIGSPITSSDFEQRVSNFARRYL